ncbi:C1 family peptidase [Microcoleus sp. FACHB-672]|uniref:C1 family peptidase n=1 Tax=Microcoleus sp. FACHB-672 TaxID=2692825 RepID=UPI00168684D8|nr:C1 family peptidase [Microcoleus sp. FACHB-672]MBD2042693.1 C1 family peptidase [Microcoleus sp. FACHB-672]
MAKKSIASYLIERSSAKKQSIASYLVERSSGKKLRINGCLPSQKKPPKSKHYTASRFSAAELPIRVDLRHYLTNVEDQGQVGSCTANAIAGAYEYLAKRAMGDAGDVSRLFIYYNARKFDGLEGDVGSSITTSIRVLQEMGACTEATWPYDPQLWDEQPYTEAYDEATRFLIEEAEEIDVNLFAMKHCLAEGYPFAFGLRLFKSFDKAGHKGGVPMPDLNHEDGREEHGNHAMLCVGYSDPYKVFVVRNSWGENWGDKGYCYIPYEYMTNPEYCWQCWTIRGVSDLDFSAGVWAEDDEDFYYYDEEDEEEEYTYEYYYEEEEYEYEEEEESEDVENSYEEESEEDEEEYYEEEEESEDVENSYEEESEEDEEEEDYEEEEGEEEEEDYEGGEDEEEEDYEGEEDEEEEDYEEEEDEEEE